MNRLDKAGKAFRDDTASEEDFLILNDWRVRCSAELSNIRTHINGLLKGLQIELKQDALVSQRLKRLPTIISKLRHYPTMKLSTMQDIAGIRVMFRDSVTLSRFLGRIQKEDSGFKVARDYIKTPAESGYRGIHLVKTMNSKVKVELQIRTEIQHAWATTVEISDVLYTQEGDYKRDHTINTDRSQFFQEVSKLMGMYERGETLDNALVERVLALDTKTALTKQVQQFGSALGLVDELTKDIDNPGSYWLIELLSPGVSFLRALESNKSELIQKYTDLEKEGKEAVMVKVDDYESLKQAYPNYLGDASRFIDFINGLSE